MNFWKLEFYNRQPLENDRYPNEIKKPRNESVGHM